MGLIGCAWRCEACGRLYHEWRRTTPTWLHQHAFAPGLDCHGPVVEVEIADSGTTRAAVDRERAYREALERISKTKSIDVAQGIALSALGMNHLGGGK